MWDNLMQNLKLLHTLQDIHIDQNSSVRTKYTPITIFPDRVWHDNCAGLGFETELQPSEVESVSLDNLTMLKKKLHDYALQYTVCTSFYKDLILEIQRWYTGLQYKEPTWNTGFIFEEVALPVLNDLEWIENIVWRPFKRSEKTKLNISTLFTQKKKLSIIANADHLKTRIMESYSNNIRFLLSELYQNTTIIYSEALSYLGNLQVYFDDEMQLMFHKHAKNISMLRVPQLQLNDANNVTFKYNARDVWKVWPHYMDIAYFEKHQVTNVFKEIKLHFFDQANDILSEIDLEIERRVNDIEISLNSLKSELDDFTEKSKLDENLVR